MKRIVCILVVILLIFAPVTHVEAQEGPCLIPARATAYCLNGVTASGCKTRKGICAGSEEMFGKTILVYQRMPDDSVGSLIGIYEVLDKGGTDAIRNGDVIDVWMPTYEDCEDYMEEVYAEGCNGKVWIVITDAVG